MKVRLKSLPQILAAAVLAVACAAPALAQFAASAAAPAAASAPAAATPAAAASASAAPGRPGVRPGDYIVAVVNSESVTANEVAQRMQKLRDEQAQRGGPAPTTAELHKMALDQLVEERVLVTYARENGVKVDDAEVDRAVANIAGSNKLTTAQLRERLGQQGMDWGAFRTNIRDQILIERVREREVVAHIRVTDSEINDYLAKQRGPQAAKEQVNLAQILVTVPERASDDVVAQRKARAEEALARVNNGEPFEQVAREMSEDANKAKGGEMGARPLDRYPDLFVNAVRDLKVGAVTPLIRSGAGFHILKVVSRGQDSGMTIVQTRVRHIVMRPTAQSSVQQTEDRLREMRQAIMNGSARFEDLARQYSEDASAPQGGDLGWVSPGTLVPEFEDAMNKLPTGGVSNPVQSRFGVHLIQVLDRREQTLDPKQVREQATNVLKEEKFEPAYAEWVADLRAKAFIEYREPPQQLQ
jgi:peptidyl-prolyl cis-trans isomerase SurA